MTFNVSHQSRLTLSPTSEMYVVVPAWRFSQPLIIQCGEHVKVSMAACQSTASDWLLVAGFLLASVADFMIKKNKKKTVSVGVMKPAEV